MGVLKWCEVNGCPLNVTAAYAAARGGHPEMLPWYEAEGYRVPCYTFTEAARGGHLPIVQWCMAVGCPECAGDWFDGDHNQNAAISAAAAGGTHFELLQWLIANGSPVDTGAGIEATRGGHLEVLKRCRQNDCS